MLDVFIYRVEQNNSCMFEFPRLSPTHQLRAANAQPISPDGICVTELSKVFFVGHCTRLALGSVLYRLRQHYCCTLSLCLSLAICMIFGTHGSSKYGTHNSVP